LLSPALLVLIFGVVIPFCILLTMSFWTREGFDFDTTFTTANYIRTVEEPIFGAFLMRSFWVSGIATIVTVLLCYPMAYYVAFHVHRNKMLWIILMTLPFWTSYLLRVFAWKVVLGYEGVINSGLLGIGIIDEPLVMLQTDFAVYIGIVYTYLPFMILPIYAALDRMDDSLIEAAEDLGCSRLSAFWLVTIPLSKSGIIAGCFLVFIPALGEFVIPSLLGGSGTLMIGKVLFEEFFNNRDWPVASAVAVILLLILIVPIVLFQRNQQKQAEAEA
jgi:ABC-type spermidine/putrescine transport system permease subunit I